MGAASINALGPILRKKYGGAVRKLCLRVGATCPNRDGSLDRRGCIFCSESITSAEPIQDQLTRGLRRLGSDVSIIAYIQDHSATYIPAEQLDAALDQIRAAPGVGATTIGTRPDCLPPRVIEVLARHATAMDLVVELGLQSASDETLNLLNRRHSVEDFEEAVANLHARGIRVCAHVILGLPTPDDAGLRIEDGPRIIKTARLIARVGVEAVKIHNCHVLRGTALAELFARGEYRPPGLEEYTELLFTFLEHIPASVEIHRLLAEARPPELIAPAFTGDKNRSLHLIRSALHAKKIFQGRLAGANIGSFR